MGTRVANNLETVQQLLTKIALWTQKFREAGMFANAEPSSRYQYNETVVEHPEDYIIGDPYKHAKGIPQRTTKRARMKDKVFEIVKDVLPVNIPEEIEVYHIEHTQYRPVDEGVQHTPIYYVPLWTIQKTVQPVLIFLNFDRKLTAEEEALSFMRWFPLAKADALFSLGIHLLAWDVVTTAAESDPWALVWLTMLSDPTYGLSFIREEVQNLVGDNQSVVDETFNLVQQVQRTSSFLNWISQTLKRQLMPNVSYESIIAWFADPETIEEYIELQDLSTNLTRLVQVCGEHPPRIEHVTTDARHTLYTVEGPVATVYTRTFSFTPDGTYAQTRTEVRHVLSQHLIQSLRLLKQVVHKYVPVDETIQHNRTVSVPCANWTDVSRLAGIFTLHHYTQAGEGQTHSITQIKEAINQVLNDPSLIRMQLRWEAITGKTSVQTAHLTVKRQ